MRRFKLLLAAVPVLLVLGATPAAAATDPYASGTTGYDVSYPSGNCSAQPSGAFGIVGVNGGRPFTVNSCLGTEYSWAASHTGSVSLYINTGYSGAYRKSITSSCVSLASGGGLSGSAEQAWEIGCSEADTSIADANGLGAVAAWWLDVETGNSWSSSNLALNRDAIQGAVTRLLQVSPNVGAYSDTLFWKTITGGNGWTPSGLAADWVAAGGCPTATATSAFTSSPVWLSQQGTVGGVDSDLAC